MGSRATALPRRLAVWIAGAERRVLNFLPGEEEFFEAHGLVIAVLACVTGFALTVAASGWWNKSMLSVSYVGVVFTLVMILIDHLIYKAFSTNWLLNIVLALPRVALTVALALVLGLPMVQFIYHRQSSIR